MIELKIQKRDPETNLEDIRSAGSMPAVFYGKKDPSTPIALSRVDFLRAWKQAGESSVVTLKMGDESIDTLIHDVDFDPVTSIPRHADFYVFDKTHKLQIDVPLEFIGVAPGVKDFGGSLTKVLFEIKVEALPMNLPHQIDVDVSTLTEIGSQILAKDLKLPTGVTLAENEDEVVVLVSAPKEEEVETAPIDISQIEVEKKGKEAKEGEDAGEAPASE